MSASSRLAISVMEIGFDRRSWKLFAFASCRHTATRTGGTGFHPRRRTLVCNHLHAHELTCTTVSYYHPENQNKAAPSLSHTNVLTLSDMFTLQTAPRWSCWETASSAGRPHRRAVTRMNTVMLNFFFFFSVFTLQIHPSVQLYPSCHNVRARMCINPFVCLCPCTWTSVRRAYTAFETKKQRHKEVGTRNHPRNVRVYQMGGRRSW